jgi:ribonuclease HI
MGKNKFYVVWKGHQRGVFSSWAECQKAIHGYAGALYKGYPNQFEAEEAFRKGYVASKSGAGMKLSPGSQKVIWNSLSVDAACSGNPGPMEYQGVDTKTKKVIFHKAFSLGTNNIGEFLALVHGLAYLKQQKIRLPIYSDSQIAIGWVKKKQCKTKLEETPYAKELFELVRRAEQWLKENTYDIPILKWDTAKWGEIPADFGRK